jgi:hypothetical protein
MALETKDSRRFISVLGSAGDFREAVDEGTEGAKKRTYETSDGKTGEKWEIPYKAIGGTITDIEFFEGDYGRNLILTVNIGEDEPVCVSLGTNTPFGESVLKVLPNIDFNKEVHMSPYNFTPEGGKNLRGVSVKQDGKKVENAFYNYETKESLLGYPEPEGDTSSYDSDDWKMYFTACRKHTIKYAEENILPQFGGAAEAAGEEL